MRPRVILKVKKVGLSETRFSRKMLIGEHKGKEMVTREVKYVGFEKRHKITPALPSRSRGSREQIVINNFINHVFK